MNIVYDLLQELRKEHSPSAENVLLKFFLEGSNAYKISKGSVSLNFIATTLQLEALYAIKILNVELSENAADFYRSYWDIRCYIEANKLLQNTIGELKKGNLYSTLENGNVLALDREKNEKAQTNKYLIDRAISRGLEQRLYDKWDITNDDYFEAINQINSFCAKVINQFKEISENTTKEAYEIALWDASEWLCKAYVVLKVAVGHRPNSASQATIFENVVLQDIVARSKEGKFPAVGRDKAVDKVEITPLFTKKIFAGKVVELIEEKYSSISQESSSHSK